MIMSESFSPIFPHLLPLHFKKNFVSPIPLAQEPLPTWADIYEFSVSKPWLRLHNEKLTFRFRSAGPARAQKKLFPERESSPGTAWIQRWDRRLRSRALLRGRSRFRSSGLLSGGALRGRLGGGAGGSLPLRVLTLDVRLQIIQASGLQIGDVLV